jgi:hypothetical protein
VQTDLRIDLCNMPRSEALEARIRDDFAKLELVHPRV